MENKQTFFEQQPVVTEPGLLDVRQQTPDVLPVKKPKYRWMWLVFAIAFIAVIVAILINFQRHSNKKDVYDSTAKIQEVNLSGVSPVAKAFTVKDNDRVVFNGQLQANEGIILSPTPEPTAAVLGQIYLDETTKQLRYYNGTEFVTLGTTTHVTNIIGATTGGVTSLQGTTGNLTLSNASLSGSTITIDNASTVAKGIASFNSTNFNIAAGVVNTIQDLATTSSPQFAGINFKNGGGGIVTLQSSVSSGTLSFTLPSADGGAGDCLTTDGGGVLSFVACGGAVPTTRTLTINGSTQDLSANRSWTVGDMLLGTGQSVTALKTFDKDMLAMKGTSTGITTISTANAGASNYTATLQAATGTIAYQADTTYIGTTSIALNRASTVQSLTGITSIDGTSAGLTAQYIDWSSGIGGNSIANKPTLGTMAALNNPLTAIGDIWIGGAAGAPDKLVDVAAGQPLLSGGLTTAPAYAGYTFSGTAGQTYTFPAASSTLLASGGDGSSLSGVLVSGNSTQNGYFGNIYLDDIDASNHLILDYSSNVAADQTLSIATTGSYSLTVNESGTVCIQSSVSCGFATSSGSGSYIQNQNAGQQAASNFWISGTGRADTSFTTPLLDTATGVALALGTTNATAINLNQNTTIASAKTLTVTSGATTLTGASTGDALTVSNSTSTGNIAVFKDNSTAVLTLANDGGALFQNATDSTTAFQIQNASAVDLLNVNTSTTANLVGNSSIEQNTNGWSAKGSAIISIDDTVAAQYGTRYLKAATTAAVNDGAKYSVPLKASTEYSLSVWLRLSAGSATTINIGEQENGSDVECLIGQTVNTTWTQFTCTFTTSSPVNFTTNLYVKQTDNVGRSIYIDGLTLVAGASAQTFDAGGANLNVQSLNSNITLNAGNTGEIQPWQLNANKLSEDRNGATSVIANGYLYVLGGSNDGGATSQSTVWYAKLNADGSAGAWTTNAANPLPQALQNHATVVANGYVYVMGGGSSGTNKSTVYYAKLNTDGSTGAWQTNANALPVALSLNNNTSITANGYVYVLGGCGASCPVSTVYYAKLNADGSTGPWVTNSNSLPATRNTGSVAVANGYVYYFGGTGGGTTTVYYAKLNADGSIAAWSTNTKTIPVATQNQSSVVSNGYVYLIGGCSNCAVSYYTTVYYAKLNADGSTGSWITSANAMPVTVAAHAYVASNGYIYTIGGYHGGSAVYYTSTSRVLLGGSLDLVGLGGQNLADSGGTGGTLTAGNTTIVGTFDVRDNANFLQGVTVGGSLSVNSSAAFQNGANSTSAFSIQNSSATNLFNVDTVNSTIKVGNNSMPYAMSLPGVSGAYGSTPDSAGNSITGDIDIRVRVAANDWTPSANQILASKWTTTGNQRSYFFQLDNAGKLQFLYSPDGSTIVIGTVSNILPFTDGQAGWVRVTYASGSGAINYYYASDSVSVPTSWTAVGSNSVTAGSIFDSTAVTEIGTGTNGTQNPFAGTVYRGLIYNGIGGTLAADFDPTRAATTGATTFVASTGETWTRNGTATFLANSSATFGSTENIFNNASTFRNGTDSTTGFQVLDTDGGTPILNVDTTNERVGIGTAAPAATLHVSGNTMIIGEGHGGTPTATIIQGAAAAGTDVAGADLYLDASNGTGIGGSGRLVLRTAKSAATGSITEDNSTSANTVASSAASLTWSHTVLSNSNRILIVGVSLKDGGGQTVSTVTFNGVSLTKLTAVTSSNARAEIWYLVNPDVTTASVVVTPSAVARMVAGATSYYNVNQVTPFGTAVTASNNNDSSTASATVSSAPDELVIDMLAKNNSDSSPTPDSSQTSRWSDVTTNSDPTLNTYGTSSSKLGALSTTMSWSWTTNRFWALIAVPLKPVGGSTGNSMAEVFSLNNDGRAILQNSVNSTTAFQVQNAASSTIFNVDTSNGKVGTPNTATASTHSNAFVLQSGNASGATSNSGNVTIDVGTATGTVGTIYVGTTNALTVVIGKTGNTLTVDSNATFNGTLTVRGHVISSNAGGGSTTITAEAASCTSPTVMTVTGNDTAGLISIKTGTACGPTGALATITFASTYGAAPRVIFTPTNAAATGLTYYNGSANGTTFTLDTNTVPVDATDYTYNYFVIK